MRTTGSVRISLPPELAAEADRLAAREGRTKSEVLRAAFRQYAARRERWDQLFSYGAERSAAGGLMEESVTDALKARRRVSR